ncbi:hypothetical protein J2Z21_008693 [Streptomyces griseochromogenes]|uniref:Uncharacterized protein n=1 Tax=Streptomyces griseochromogenes TaxID=68214 RepID=A0A1B1B079_9ACTN|nr:hypothetical protein [Streptomyces griseochromogenes]ANP52228.1 hypothetical protein AVL59_24130 [Streptomyces griseochromogenes]MBP2055677.1 hypothetical protein [Streptomyces griseochromogenes]
MILARCTTETWRHLAPIAGPAPKDNAHPGRVHVVQHGTAHQMQVVPLTGAEAADWLTAAAAGGGSDPASDTPWAPGDQP